MALERRESGHYYYRYKRDGDKVRKVYMGAGEIARIWAKHARAQETEKKALADRERKERERIEGAAPPVLELEDVAQVLARAHLVAGGYRRVKGEWRMPKDG